MDPRIPDKPSQFVIDEAIREYGRLTHNTVTVEQVKVVSVSLLLPTLLGWHIQIEGEIILIWDPCEILPPHKEEAQEVAA